MCVALMFVLYVVLKQKTLGSAGCEAVDVNGLPVSGEKQGVEGWLLYIALR